MSLQLLPAGVRKKKSDPPPDEVKSSAWWVLLMFCFGDQCGMATVRNQIREDTNMVHSECCNKACWDICLSTVFCWGCAAVQMKRELQVWFGHAGPEAPVHPGSPAARKA